jgi:hypothetical protein
VLGVCNHVFFGCFFRVVFGQYMVAMRQMGVVTSFFVFARFVVLRGREVLPGSLLVMMCCLTMMFSAFL